MLDSFEQSFIQKYEKAVIDGMPTFKHRNHEIAIKGKSLEELKQGILAGDKPFLNSILFPQIAETTMKWLSESILSLVALKTDAEFIISDSPVTTEWSRDNKGALNRGHVRCIPLDGKRILKLSPNHDGKNPFMLHKIYIPPEYENM